MNISVFLADDHGMLLDGLCAMLTGQPDISIAGRALDGQHAIAEITRLRPEIAVLDIAMPLVNGIEVTRIVRKLRHPPQVIILSMHGTPDHIRQAFEAGARGYLLKESAGSEMIAAVRTVYAGQRYMSRRVANLLADAMQSTQFTANPFEELTPRELEVLHLVVDGLTTAEIAARLSLSPRTIDTYRSRVLQKLGVTSLPDLVKIAIQYGLASL